MTLGSPPRSADKVLDAAMAFTGCCCCVVQLGSQRPSEILRMSSKKNQKNKTMVMPPIGHMKNYLFMHWSILNAAMLLYPIHVQRLSFNTDRLHVNGPRLVNLTPRVTDSFYTCGYADGGRECITLMLCIVQLYYVNRSCFYWNCACVRALVCVHTAAGLADMFIFTFLLVLSDQPPVHL